MAYLATPQQRAELSSSDREQFWNDGFLVVNDVFSPAEVETLRSVCELPDVIKRKDVDVTVHDLGITAHHAAFLEMAKDPRIVDRVTSLIGPNVQLQHSKLAAKATTRGKGTFSWHQDFAFFPHTNTDLVAVMVLIDDATPENGGMSMVKGSYKRGLLEHRQDGYFTGACQQPLWEEQLEQVVPIIVKAGGISLHHCLTLHGSPPNLSGKPRRGLVFQYRACDAYQLADSVWNDTGLLVAGQYREQARCTVGTVWLPKFPGRQEPYGTAYNQVGSFAQEINQTDQSAGKA